MWPDVFPLIRDRPLSLPLQCHSSRWAYGSNETGHPICISPRHCDTRGRIRENLRGKSTMKITLSILPVVFILLIVASFSLKVAAQSEGDKSETKAVIEERSELMRSIRDTFRPIRPMLMAGAFEIIIVKSRELANLAQEIMPAFSKKALSNKSRAKDEIWKNRSQFTQKAKKLAAAIAELEQAAKTSDTEKTGGRIAGVLAACKNCHRSFRKPKTKGEDKYQG